jgi:hypothetical protein
MLWDETKIGCSSQSSTPCVGSRKKWGRDEGNPSFDDLREQSLI